MDSLVRFVVEEGQRVWEFRGKKLNSHNFQCKIDICVQTNGWMAGS